MTPREMLLRRGTAGRTPRLGEAPVEKTIKLTTVVLAGIAVLTVGYFLLGGGERRYPLRRK